MSDQEQPAGNDACLGCLQLQKDLAKLTETIKQKEQELADAVDKLRRVQSLYERGAQYIEELHSQVRVLNHQIAAEAEKASSSDRLVTTATVYVQTEPVAITDVVSIPGKEIANADVEMTVGEDSTNTNATAWVSLDDTAEEGEIVQTEPVSVAESLREAAEAAQLQTGYVYDEGTGLYFDKQSGYYYDAEKGLHYEPYSGIYYYFNTEKNTYEYHSRADLTKYSSEAYSRYYQNVTGEKPKKQKKPKGETESTEQSQESDLKRRKKERKEDQDSKNKRKHNRENEGERAERNKHRADKVDSHSQGHSSERPESAEPEGKIPNRKIRSRDNHDGNSSPESRKERHRRHKRKKRHERDKNQLEFNVDTDSRESKSTEKTYDSVSKGTVDLELDSISEGELDPEIVLSSADENNCESIRDNHASSKAEIADGCSVKKHKSSRKEKHSKAKKRKKSHRRSPSPSREHQSSKSSRVSRHKNISEDVDMDCEEAHRAEEGELSSSSSSHEEFQQSKSIICVSSSSESEWESSSGDQAMPDISARNYPPCIRAIVTKSEVLDEGSLYIIPYTGATIGREKELNHIIHIPDPQVSKMHCGIQYNQDVNRYYVTDHASQNGTSVNDNRLSQSQVMSEPCPITHMDILSICGTTLELHIHPGTLTCDGCEPGIVMAKVQEKEKAEGKNQEASLTKQDKEKLRRTQLKQIKKKYGLANVGYVDNSAAINNPSYSDKADIRRKTVGSDNPYQKDDAPSSVHRAISSENKGRKLLSKMGWKEGDSLGKKQSGIKEPINVDFRANQSAGLGSCAAYSKSLDHVQDVRTAEKWVRAQARYNKLDGQSNTDTSGKPKVNRIHFSQGSTETFKDDPSMETQVADPNSTSEKSLCDPKNIPDSSNQQVDTSDSSLRTSADPGAKIAFKPISLGKSKQTEKKLVALDQSVSSAFAVESSEEENNDDSS